MQSVDSDKDDTGIRGCFNQKPRSLCGWTGIRYPIAGSRYTVQVNFRVFLVVCTVRLGVRPKRI